MSTAASPDESVEAFARLCAAVDDPFADQRTVLGAVGLDPASLARLQEHWAERLRRDGGADELSTRFRQAYEDARRGPRPPSEEVEHATRVTDPAENDGDDALLASVSENPEPPPETPAPAVPTFMKEPGPAQTPGGSPVPLMPAPAPLTTETAAIDVVALLKPAVPFDPHGPPATAAAVPTVVSGERPRGALSTETTVVDVSKILGARVPFVAKKASLPGVPEPAAASGPARRLVRFDPQTGKPLVEPYWEELKSPEKKP